MYGGSSFYSGGLKNMPSRCYQYTKQAELTVKIESVQKYNVTAREFGRFPCDPNAGHGNYRAHLMWRSFPQGGFLVTLVQKIAYIERKSSSFWNNSDYAQLKIAAKMAEKKPEL